MTLFHYHLKTSNCNNQANCTKKITNCTLPPTETWLIARNVLISFGEKRLGINYSLAGRGLSWPRRSLFSSIFFLFFFFFPSQRNFYPNNSLGYCVSLLYSSYQSNHLGRRLDWHREFHCFLFETNSPRKLTAESPRHRSRIIEI